MFCALSGKIPTNPVVSSASGLVFERSLIEKYLDSPDSEGKCPITGEPLALDQLIAIQIQNTSSSHDSPSKKRKSLTTTATPRATIECASVPGALQILQQEWDSSMLEMYQLKKTLQDTRQELSHALYQKDAASRVIARLLEENKILKSSNPVVTTTAAATVPMDVSENGHNDDAGPVGHLDTMIAAVQAKAQELSTVRKESKKKSKTENVNTMLILPTPESFETYACVSSHSLHKSTSPGVTCVDLSASGKISVTGGMDGQLKVFHRGSKKVLSTCTGHTKSISKVLFHPQDQENAQENAQPKLLYSASNDQTLKCWTKSAKSAKYSADVSLLHDSEVSDFVVHVTQDYLLSCERAGKWSLWNVHSGKTSTPVLSKSSSTACQYKSIAQHPDGILFGTGLMSNNGGIQMWDLTSGANVASFDTDSTCTNALSFSENGYHLASGGSDGIVRFWDLRKLTNAFSLEALEEPIECLQYDRVSGQVLTIGSGRAMYLYTMEGKKSMRQVRAWNDHVANVTSVAFNKNMTVLASTSMDRTVKFYESST